ncbi:MAG TPA: metal-dependent hydrolase [Blastocatellia bacterium]|nr:metal-dependent hydrolase [Blastocatellia bacterium]
MENLAHTLLGLTMAEAGLEAATPLATATLIISSNLPDLDLVMYPAGDALSYIRYHRGLSHSFVGLVVLALALTIVMMLFDRRLRLRRDNFRRPARPVRIFLLALLGGLVHLFLDFTNSYGVRPLMPFSGRWFYGDFVFVVDPWIWLILGFSVVWFTLRKRPRSRVHRAMAVLWITVGTLTSLVVFFALKRSVAGIPSLSRSVATIWFCGLAVVVFGAVFGWGRKGLGYARWSLLFLAIYYGALLIGHQAASQRVQNMSPAVDVAATAIWPQPANPFLWGAVESAHGAVYSRSVNLAVRSAEQAGSSSAWEERLSPSPALVEALQRSGPGQTFLNFARMPTVQETSRPNGSSVILRDSRFGLKLRAELDPDLNVLSSSVEW